MKNASVRAYGGKDPRELPIYPVAAAARYVRVPQSTLETWVAGRPASGGRQAARPLVKLAQPQPKVLSFSNLVEAFVLASMRRAYGIPLQRVRRAIDYVGAELHIPRPLIDERFKTDGLDLFVERSGKILNVSRKGQVAIRDVLQTTLKRIDWDERGIAARLYPWVRGSFDPQPRTIVIDPQRAFGRPAMKGTGVPTSVIAERYRAGESIAELQSDYDVRLELIEDAIRCELLEAA